MIDTSCWSLWHISNCQTKWSILHSSTWCLASKCSEHAISHLKISLLFLPWDVWVIGIRGGTHRRSGTKKQKRKMWMHFLGSTTNSTPKWHREVVWTSKRCNECQDTYSRSMKESYNYNRTCSVDPLHHRPQSHGFLHQPAERSTNIRNQHQLWQNITTQAYTNTTEHALSSLKNA